MIERYVPALCGLLVDGDSHQMETSILTPGLMEHYDVNQPSRARAPLAHPAYNKLGVLGATKVIRIGINNGIIIYYYQRPFPGSLAHTSGTNTAAAGTDSDHVLLHLNILVPRCRTRSNYK